MISSATKRSILRWFHLVLTIPILGFIYGKPEDVQQYAAGARFIFIPALMLSGYWMYAGAVFAIIGVAAWLGAIYEFGFGIALLSQIVLFIARRIWLVIRARQSKTSLAA